MTNMGKIVKNGIEVGASSKDVFLTQAEYDALPESKNSDGIHYIITDADADVKYAAEVMMSDGTSVEDEFDLVPKREVVTDDVEIDTPNVDADTLGGRITAENVEEIASDISTLTSNLLALGVTKIEIVTKGLTPTTTSRQYIETGISESAKIVIPVCIAPNSNADACLKDLAMQGNTILRFTASHANLSYTVKFLCVY